VSEQIDGGLGFILDAFVADTPGVAYAQTVSADGIHLAASSGLSQTRRETFAAIASGLSSLTDSAVETFGLGVVNRQIVEASGGWILLSRISTTAAMGVVAEPSADLGLIGYEMTMLAKRLGDVLSPELVDRLKNTLAGHR
jgi:hypothetical protein